MLYRENGQFKTSYRADQQVFPIAQDRIAIALLLAVALLVYGERRARGAARPMNERPRGKALYHLRGVQALAASGWCGLVFACAFVIPVLQLLVWVWQRGRFDLDERYIGLILHSLYLGGLAALLTVVAALLLVFARRLAPTRTVRSAVAVANLGYALPGSVLAVALMLAFSYLDKTLVMPLSSLLEVCRALPAAPAGTSGRGHSNRCAPRSPATGEAGDWGAQSKLNHSGCL